MGSNPPPIGANEICAAMDSSAIAVLETMFFTSVEDAQPGLPEWRGVPIGTHLTFDGPLAGDFRLLIEPETAQALASAFLCADLSEIGEEREIQLAAEIANMICGSLLSHLEPDANLTLGVPESAAESLPLDAIRRGFQLPEGAFGIEFQLNRGERDQDE